MRKSQVGMLERLDLKQRKLDVSRVGEQDCNLMSVELLELLFMF